MKYRIYILLSFVTFNVQSQFLHPTTGINGEYVGACETATCSGTYMDDGGAAGNYGNGVNSTYRVFCPNTATNCIQLTFTAFDVEPQATCSFDYLTIGNGPTQNSTLFTSAPALASGRLCGAPATPFSFTSTDASGCLTVRFASDGSVRRAGWSANISCVPCAGGPPGNNNSDCKHSTPVCNNAAFAANSTGPGIVEEGCTPGTCPAGGENFSNWYQILISSGGTLGFTITPSVGTSDFDYAVYGPNSACSSLPSPVRCNDSGTPGPTGLGAAGTNPTEPASGSQWCTGMNVTAGETYFIVVDSWSPPSGGYSLNWGGTSNFNCAVLPVQLVNFAVSYNYKEKLVDLNWSTAIESKVERFSIEHGTDGITFTEIGNIKPRPTNSQELKNYSFKDFYPESNEVNYYRLVTIDASGHKSISVIQAVAFNDDDANLKLIPNPAKEMVELNFLSKEKDNWELELFDGHGNPLQKINYTAFLSGVNKYTMYLRQYEKGMYFVRINNGYKQFKRKLIIE